MRIIQVTEGEPASRPALGVANEAAVWARFETWCRGFRWGQREIVWIVDNPGAFHPPVQPAALTKSELWDGAAWVETAGESWPRGVCYTLGTWRLTYNVGAPTARPEVVEAATRYADYVAQVKAEAAAVSVRDGDFSVQRSENAMARALELSGAADLLRAYR